MQSCLCSGWIQIQLFINNSLCKIGFQIEGPSLNFDLRLAQTQTELECASHCIVQVKLQINNTVWRRCPWCV